MLACISVVSSVGPGPGDDLPRIGAILARRLLVVGDDQRGEILIHDAGILDRALAEAAFGHTVAAGVVGDAVGRVQIAGGVVARIHHADHGRAKRAGIPLPLDRHAVRPGELVAEPGGDPDTHLLLAFVGDLQAHAQMISADLEAIGLGDAQMLAARHGGRKAHLLIIVVIVGLFAVELPDEVAERQDRILGPVVGKVIHEKRRHDRIVGNELQFGVIGGGLAAPIRGQEFVEHKLLHAGPESRQMHFQMMARPSHQERS